MTKAHAKFQKDRFKTIERVVHTSTPSFKGQNWLKVSMGAKIRNRYNQAPHLTQDTNGTAITSQLDITKENQEVSPFQAGYHKALINNMGKGHIMGKQHGEA